MDTNQIAEIIRKRLNLEDHDWSIIEKNPKFQKLFQNDMKFLIIQVQEDIFSSFFRKR